MRSRRVMVLGLDCADPRVSWGPLAAACPTLEGLRARSRWGPLRSTVPPITVPAWASMTTGASPGALGLYGLRQRVPGTYRMRVATAADVARPRAWDVLADVGRSSIVFAVPPTWPPPERAGVSTVSCFLTPTCRERWTAPAALAPELERLAGEYRMDVLGFRSPDRVTILTELCDAVDQHFAMLEHLARTRPWDLLWMVEIGLDRFHHAFWSTWNTDHPAHDPGDPLRAEATRFYARIDAGVARLLALADDRTAVLVVSDHGARTLRGSVCVNELLRREGLLSLARPVIGPTRLEDAGVDWDRTVAWGEGGYYARVWLNVRGRDPHGIVEPGSMPRRLDELATLFRSVTAPDGAALATRVVRTKDVYERTEGHPPDLMVFWDDLALRAAGTVGHEGIHLDGSDSGPDGCNHDWRGLYTIFDPRDGAAGAAGERAIESIGSTVLDLCEVPDAARPSELRSS